MDRTIAFLPIVAIMLVSACAKKETTESPSAGAEPSNAATQAAVSPEPSVGPRAFVHLKSGNKVPGTIVASSRTDMVVAGDDGIEHKIPLGQVKSVEYAGTETAARPPRRAAAPVGVQSPGVPDRQAGQAQARQPAENAVQAPVAPTPAPAPREVTTRTFELLPGSEVSVRTNEPIDSTTAAEGQTFDAQVTRDAKDANGDLVIPRGSSARVVIKSASSGGRMRGASDLVLDLQSVAIHGKQYSIDTVDVTKQGKWGVGANKRTAEYTGGGAAVGALIGAIAGGGKGAAIGAGAGAGAGALTQILTKGRAIRVPAESVLTFSLDKPLRVAQAQ